MDFVSLAFNLMKQNQGESKKVDSLTTHLPGLVTFANHEQQLPWTAEYKAVLMFADISGFTALCERYSSDQTSCGIDKLAGALNAYLGELVQEIIAAGGDVLKFAGDAILSIWRVNQTSNFSSTVDDVVNCCLRIQKQCGEWLTEIGVQLTVKLGVSAGDIAVTFIGNNECRFYVEQGSAVTDVNIAEAFCKSGYIVLSPAAWTMCKQTAYEYELMEDGNHVRIISKIVNNVADRRSFVKGLVRALPPNVREVRSNSQEPAQSRSAIDDAPDKAINEKEKINGTESSKLVKFRNTVNKVKGLNLEKKLRLYIIPPVLIKLDAGQPLEFLSEMRYVSVVFMNLVLDEEVDITQLLQDVFDILYMETKVINGCLNKVFFFDKGCTFLVLFGLPGYRHERESTRALQCSTRIKKILDVMTGVLGVSIGVTTGATFCGVVGHKRRHEYSVIGRKVNMAARLMMHYPEKVTCDDETYHSCRLANNNFDILVTKRMKGLRNVGDIREFRYNEDKETELKNTLTYFEFPILGREKETDIFLDELNKLQDDIDGEEPLHHHLVFVGAVGIGKTRLLDSFTVVSAKQNVRFLAFDLTANDVSKNYFLVRHILKVLLVKSGFSQELHTEPLLLKNLRDSNLLEYLHSFSDIIGIKLKSSQSLTTFVANDEEIRTKRKQIYSLLIQTCLEKLGPMVFILDNMRNCDNKSWEYLLLLSQCPLAFITIAVRPIIIDEPPSSDAQKFFESRQTLVKDVESIHVRLLTPLACQILDVSRLDRDINNLLKTFSHGIPKWSEQLLLDMYDKKQLLIVDEGEQQSSGLSTISPQQDYINKKPSKERRSSSVDRRRHPLVFNTSLQTSDAEEGAGFTGEMLACLGYLQTKGSADARNTTRTTGSKRIAILTEGVNIKDLHIRGNMSNMMVERLDSLRALDQLIVKCCAVIGAPFSMDIIRAVLPKANMFKVGISLRRLFNNGTFECINYRKARKLATSDDTMTSQNVCYCVSNEPGKLESELLKCNNLRFRNSLIKETAQSILMVIQRTELHLKAVEYHLSTVKNTRKLLPFHLYSDCDSKYEEFKCYTGLNLGKNNIKPFLYPSDIFEDISKTGNFLDYVHHIQKGFDSNRQSSLRSLIPVYHRIKVHLSAANENRRLLDFLVEAGSVAIYLKMSSVALCFLDEAKDAFNKLKEEKADVDGMFWIHTEACLKRLRGKAIYMTGRFEEAYKLTRSAASILGIKHPTKINIKLKMLKFNFTKFPSTLFVGGLPQFKKGGRGIAEIGNCLSDLCFLHKIKKNHRLLYLDILRLVSVIRHSSYHPQLILQTYSHLIYYCCVKKWFHLSHKLELEFFAMCVSLAKIMSFDDVECLATILSQSASTSLENGEIERATIIGKSAVLLGRTFNDVTLTMKSLPTFALATILSNRITEAIEVLLDIKTVCLDSDRRGERSWYFILVLEFMLVRCHPIETFSNCMTFAASYLRDYDAVQDENIHRFYTAMSMAVWYCRQYDWGNGQRWFDYWENYQPDKQTLLALLARLKKLECMLLSLWTAIEANIQQSVNRIESHIIKEIDYLKISSNNIPGILPRLYHLLAYYNLLKSKKSKAKYYITKSFSLGVNQGNNLDSAWSFAARNHWFHPNSEVKFWNWKSLVKCHSLEWRILSGRRDLCYIFPSPKHIV